MGLTGRFALFVGRSAISKDCSSYFIELKKLYTAWYQMKVCPFVVAE
jgi:hypothetical protein